jgi:hypothetical protein
MIMSEGVSSKHNIKEIILDCFPNAIKVERANEKEDRHGTDYWVTTKAGQEYSIDIKAREKDWRKKHPKEDDLALESWSVKGKRVGWTRDTSKRTDYILWIWLDTGRNTLVPFPMLCSVFMDKWEEWSTKHKVSSQRTQNANGSQWESQCIFVPRRDVWREIYTSFGGA